MHPCDNTETLLRMLEPFRRNHFFYGKRMDVQHFQMEQDYGKLKQWLLNRLTFGKGVACGLGVSIKDGKLCVDPGFAIDGLGREIVVPVRACIDPVTQEGGCCPEPCCKETGATPPPRRDDDATAPSHPEPDRHADRLAPERREGFFTLWVCYRECRTDYQPVLVSDCGTRDQCAPGTIVETFCLKVTPGTPPAQGDPEWCAKLWEVRRQPARDQPAPGTHDISHLAPYPPRTPTADDLPNALTSRRRLLCELFDQPCDPPEGDPCVPLAVFQLDRDREIRFDSCIVRPRVYSNAVLLDLILCLADKIDECCDGKPEHPEPEPEPAEPMRVKSVEFLGGPNHEVIAAVQSPLDVVSVPIRKQANSIRVKFTQAFDQGAKAPTTPGPGDSSWKRHNVLVTPESDRQPGHDYVPGSIAFEAPDTLRWDLYPEPPFYSPRYKGWQKGTRRLTIFGDPDPGAHREPVSNTSGIALDGEPIAPGAGVVSGDGTPGGIFTLLFRVG
jgi:hypothetical protein